MPADIGNMCIEYSSVSELISTIATMKASFDNMVVALKQIEGTIDNNWQGNVTKPFCDDYRSCMKKLYKVDDLLDRYVSAIAEAAAEFKTADSQAGTRAVASLGGACDQPKGKTILKFRTIQDGPTF